MGNRTLRTRNESELARKQSLPGEKEVLSQQSVEISRAPCLDKIVSTVAHEMGGVILRDLARQSDIQDAVEICHSHRDMVLSRCIQR